VDGPGSFGLLASDRLIRRLDGQPQEALNRVYYTAALATDPQEYERRVVGLFDRALLR